MSALVLIACLNNDIFLSCTYICNSLYVRYYDALSFFYDAGIKSMTSNNLTGSSSVLCVSTRANRTPSVKTFSLVELEKATDGFCSKRILGEGGFGCVYHGILEDGSEVAIKLLTREDQNGDREFIAEIQMLSRLHHRNLVKLIGICIEGHKRCLVYELVRNGSVESHLHGMVLISKIAGFAHGVHNLGILPESNNFCSSLDLPSAVHLLDKNYG